MTIKSVFCSLISALTLAIFATPATADIAHSVKFSAEKTVILLGEETSHTATPSITAMPAIYTAPRGQFTAPIVQTGVLEPIKEQAMPLKQSQNSRATFNVVSNTAYGIRAEISTYRYSAAQSDLSTIPFIFDLKSVGPKASAPEAGAFYARNLSLSDLSRPRTIFRSSQRTAAQRGDPADQSLEFEASWGQLGGQEPIEISFTIFVP